MSDDWYVRIGHKTLGPLTEIEVRHVLEAGRINAETPVRRGADGPWTPAGQALADGKGKSAPATPKRRLRTPITIAIVATLAVLVAIRWVAVRVGHREVPDAAATAPSEDVTKSDAVGPTTSAVESAKPAMQIPAVPVPPVAAPAVPPRQSLIAKRPAPKQPSQPTAGGRQAAVARDGSPANLSHAEAASKLTPKKIVESQPKPAAVASKPKVAVVKIAPVVVPNGPATQADLGALELTALRSSSAKDALALYQVFRATRAISPAVEDSFKGNLQAWEIRAGQGLVRLGDQWVASTDAAKAHEQATQLFQQAYELIKALNFDEAQRTLEAASRVDPNSIAADFTLGIVRSIAPAKSRSPLTAAKHFEAVLGRSPGYIPALNNLALVEIHGEKYAEAVRHLRDAADHSPVPDEVTQNLGRFVSEAQLGRIRPSPPVLSEATELYSRVVTTQERAALADRPKHGWRYMPLVLPQVEREGLSRLLAPQADATTVVQGTGLVVAPHYVLTCRHLVDDLSLGRADRIELVDPADFRHERRLPAVLVAVDEADDLCLLRCDGLNVPPTTLAELLPPRGSEMLLLSFQGGSVSRPGLKVTLGLVTAVPGEVPRAAGPKWLDFSRQLWCDAGAGHRAKGGAICDDRGNIVAIHAASYAFGSYASGKDASYSVYAGGVPAPSARAFVRSSLPSFGQPAVAGPSLSWSGVEPKVSRSLVSVVIGYRKVLVVMSGRADASRLTQGAREAEADLYDDRCCTVCNGRARVLCRAPGCPFARLHDESVAHDPSAADTPKTSARHTCPACLGTGYVRCPHCSIGIDPLLR
jgi:tetratricopeptide (TPR) repeat protein